MEITRRKPTISTIELHRRSFLQTQNIKPGTIVVCEKGTLWVTQSEDYRDYMLESGEKIVIGKKQSVLIEALSEAGLSLICPN